MKMPFAIHQSFYFALGIVLMKSVSLLMLPVVTRYLSPAQFGDLELLLAISDFVCALTGYALVDALYRFAGMSKHEKEEKHIGANIFGMAVVIALVTFVIGLLLAQIFQSKFGETVSLFDLQLLAFLFSVEGCLVMPLAWIKMKEKAIIFFLLTTGKAVCQAIVSWQLLEAGYGITAMLIGGALSSLLMVTVLIWLQLRETGIRLDRERLPEIFWYCLPLVGSALVAYAMLSIDRFVINMVSTPTELGLYSVGKKLALVSVLLMQPFLLWWGPRRIRQLQEDNGLVSVARTTSLGLALIICFTAMICIGSPVVIGGLIDAQYAGAMNYVPAMALLLGLKQFAEMANVGCFVGKSTWIVMAIDVVVAITAMIFLYFLGEAYQVFGVIAALLIAQLLRVVLFYVASQRVVALDYAKGKLALLSCLCFGLTYLSLQLEGLLSHFLMTVVSTLVLLGYMYFSGLLGLRGWGRAEAAHA